MTQQTNHRRSAGEKIEGDTDETTLLARVRGGDEASCEEFVRRYGGPMLAVARRFLRCEQDAADAVQEAFLSAFRSIHGFAGNSRIGTWLHRVVVNACLMKLRSAKSRPTTPIESLLPAFDETGHHARGVSAWDAPPPERLHAAELRVKVRECIEELPEPYRVVLLLRDIEELDTQETAERLAISPAAVKVRLHRARQALRTLLEPLFVTDGERNAPAR
jgi:RNA polymerase sigma-70 factor, ECF subfamily